MQQQNQSLTELRQLTQAIVYNTVESLGVDSAVQAAITTEYTVVALLKGTGILGTNVFAAKKSQTGITSTTYW